MLSVLEEPRPHVVLRQVWERWNPVDLRWGGGEAKPVHPLQRGQFPVDGRACRALFLAFINVPGEEVTGNVHRLQSTKERLNVKPPACLYIIEAPASVHFVVPQETISQFCDGDALDFKPIEGTRRNLGEASGEEPLSLGPVGRVGGLAVWDTVTVILDPPDAATPLLEYRP